MKKSNIFSFLVLVFLIALPFSAFALQISGVGERGGSFSGSIEYFPGNGLASTIDAAGGWLLISLTNTSERSGLYLAAFSLYSPYPYIAARSEAVLGAGQMATFYFPVMDQNYFYLTTESYLSERSEFVVYFRDRSGSTADIARVAAVPEPETLLLLGFGLLAIGIGLRKKTQ